MSAKTIDRYVNLLRQYPELERDRNVILDKKTLRDYESAHACDMGLVYESQYHLLLIDLTEENGEAVSFERLISKNSRSAVVIIPKYNDKFILLNQFRHATGNFQLAFPRGYGERGLTAVENAEKELSEELKSEMLSCDVLGKVVADSGVCGDYVTVCFCDVTRPEPETGYEGIQNVVFVTMQELQSMIADGKIEDGFTLSATAIYLSKIKNAHILG